MQNEITSAINDALTVATSPRTIRATITEERITFLRKLMPKDTALAQAAHRWRAALTDQDAWRAAQQIRRYIPQALNMIWIAQDARKSAKARRAFNPIRFDASVTV